MNLAAVIGIIAGLAGVVALWVNLIQLRQSRSINQKLLDILPSMDCTALDRSANTSKASQLSFIMEQGMALADIDGAIDAPPEIIHRALRDATRRGKVSLVVINGIADEVPGVGTARVQIPLFFKGGIDPSLRADQLMIDRLFDGIK